MTPLTIDQLARRAGLAVGCEGLAALLTLAVPPGQVPVPGFPGGELIGGAGLGVCRLIRFPAAHLVQWCNAQRQTPHARALFSTFPTTVAVSAAALEETDHV